MSNTKPEATMLRPTDFPTLQHPNLTKGEWDLIAHTLRVSLASILNVSSTNSVALMRSVRERLLNGKLKLEDCSQTVCNAFELYERFLFMFDPQEAQKSKICMLNPHGLNLIKYA